MKKRNSNSLSFDYRGLDLDAEFTYYPGDPGRVSGPPEKCYPPEPAEVEIVSLKYKGLDVMYLLDSTLCDEIHDKLLEAYEEPDDYEEPHDFRDDVEADADTLKSAGWGTDEDYGHLGQD